jgi:proteasome lid subunit RPN8/RPN11
VSQLQLSHGQFAEMQAHVQGCLPEEACGLLAGLDGVVREVIPVQNQARSPFRFQMDPHEQLRAFQHIESRGWELLGIFHSHPAGPPGPSATDIAEAAYDVVHIIWSRDNATWQAGGFRIQDGAASKVELSVSAEPGSSTAL